MSRKSGTTALLLWACIFIGLGGLHRFYVGRKWTGLLYLLTLGLLGVGQLIDLFKLGGMVRMANLEDSVRYSGGGGAAVENTNTVAPVFNVSVHVPSAEAQAQQKLIGQEKQVN
jgi:TM2 domain-containing membrane protein YozV